MLRVHFLNVGHGDCCILESPTDTGRRITVVDINRIKNVDEPRGAETSIELGGTAAELTDPIHYLRSVMGAKSVFRFISTHPHMDHLTGLRTLCDEFDVRNMWIQQNEFQWDGLTGPQKADWDLYCKYRDDGSDSLRRVLRPMAGSSGDYAQDEVGITVLAPNPELIELAHRDSNPNIMSYVLVIQYGECKIVLGGDAEEPTWEYVFDNYQDELRGVAILKASHHGQDSGCCQPAVELMRPTYTIISVGKQLATDASDKYKQYSRHVWSTRQKGTIVFECHKDGSVTSTVEYDR